MPVDALFERGELEDFVHGELAGLGHFAFDGNSPVRCVEVFRIFRGVALVGAEFVEIVVVRDVAVRILFFGGAERALGKAAEFCSSKDGLGRSGQFEKTATGHGSDSSDAHGAEELPPI